MKEVLVILITLILTVFLASFTYHLDQEFVPANPLIECQEEEPMICVQCITRGHDIQ